MRRRATPAVLACPSAAPGLATRLVAPGQLRVSRTVDDAAELLAAAHAGLAIIALVGADLPGLDAPCLDELRSLNIAIVGVLPGSGSPATEAAGERLAALGIAVVVTADAGALEVGVQAECALGISPATNDTAGRATARDIPQRVEPELDHLWVAPGQWREVTADFLDRPQVAPRQPGKVIAVWGPAGAPGRSTITASLAAVVARTRSCLLLDVDPYGGAQSHLFGCNQESSGLAAAVHAAVHERLDLGRLRDLSVEVAPNLRLLTGLSGPADWPRLRPAGLASVIEQSRRVADIVLLDCGFCLEDDEELSYDTRAPRRNAATLTALEVCDEIVVVSTVDRIGQARLSSAIPTLADLLDPRTPRRVVRNRVREPSATRLAGGAAASDENLAQLIGSAHVEAAHRVPHDPEAFDAALRAGRPVTQVAPHSPAAKAIEGLAEALCGAFDRPAARRGV